MHVTECYGSPVTNRIYEYKTDRSDVLVQTSEAKRGVFKQWSFKKFFHKDLFLMPFEDGGVSPTVLSTSSMFWQNKPSNKIQFVLNDILCSQSEVFLPQGYPDSVSEDYFNYQVWDTIQAFCSSITGTLATQAVLKGSGVGDSTATAAGATVTWLLKDGTGMVGRIAFAYINGTYLDCNAKQWRLFADVLNDCAMFVQLLAPLLPKTYFTPVMCLSGLAYSLVGVAGGCTRAALTMHQAKRNNMADVSAKDGSQETLVNLVALITSLIITPLVSGHATATWSLFVIFALLHVYANYKAVSCVVMEIFNRIRLFTVIDCFLSPSKYSFFPMKVNQAEALFFPPNCSWLKLGCKVEDLNLTSDEFQNQILLKSRPKWLIKQDKNTKIIYTALSHGVSAEDIIRATYQSYLLYRNLTSYSIEEERFIQEMRRAGWNLEVQQLCADEWRWSADDALHQAKKEQDKFV